MPRNARPPRPMARWRKNVGGAATLLEAPPEIISPRASGANKNAGRLL
jgi:hypothetical protein